MANSMLDLIKETEEYLCSEEGSWSDLQLKWFVDSLVYDAMYVSVYPLPKKLSLELDSDLPF